MKLSIFLQICISIVMLINIAFFVAVGLWVVGGFLFLAQMISSAVLIVEVEDWEEEDEKIT